MPYPRLPLRIRHALASAAATPHASAGRTSPTLRCPTVTDARRAARHPIARAGVSAMLASAVLLSGCGGGGSGSSDSTSVDESPTAVVDEAGAVDLAADTTVTGQEALTAVDAAVLTATWVATSPDATAAAATPTERQALGLAQAQASVSVPVACPGGGSARLTVSGDDAATLLNGRLDAGERHTLTFSACRLQTGSPALDGLASMTVAAAAGTTAELALEMSALAVTLARGRITLDGDVDWHGDRVDSGEDSQLTTRLAIARLGLTTQFDSRAASFELRDLAVARQGLWRAGVPVSGSAEGHYTIAGSRSAGSFEATVSTQGSTSYGADGTPVSGVWTVAFDRWSLQLSASAAGITLSIDEGQDGSIDRSWSTSGAALSAAAG